MGFKRGGRAAPATSIATGFSPDLPCAPRLHRGCLVWWVPVSRRHGGIRVPKNSKRVCSISTEPQLLPTSPNLMPACVCAGFPQLRDERCNVFWFMSVGGTSILLWHLPGKFSTCSSTNHSIRKLLEVLVVVVRCCFTPGTSITLSMYCVFMILHMLVQWLVSSWMMCAESPMRRRSSDDLFLETDRLRSFLGDSCVSKRAPERRSSAPDAAWANRRSARRCLSRHAPCAQRCVVQLWDHLDGDRQALHSQRELWNPLHDLTRGTCLLRLLLFSPPPPPCSSF